MLFYYSKGNRKLISNIAIKYSFYLIHSYKRVYKFEIKWKEDKYT